MHSTSNGQYAELPEASTVMSDEGCQVGSVHIIVAVSYVAYWSTIDAEYYIPLIVTMQKKFRYEGSNFHTRYSLSYDFASPIGFV